MTRRLNRLEPAASAPDTARSVAALFFAVGLIGATPGLCGVGIAFTLVMEGAPGSGWYWGLLGLVWLLLGFVQWGFHITRAARPTNIPDSAPRWWLFTFVYNAIYAIAAAIVMYQDPHPATIGTTVWFVVLSVLAVRAYRDDEGHQRRREPSWRR